MSPGLSQVHASATWWRGLGLLFWLYFSWRSVVLACAALGMGLLALVLMSWSNSSLAFALSIFAFSLLLGAPFLAAPPLMRTLIGHRSISMAPRLPMLAGLALLLLTMLTAVFLPLAAALLGVSGVSAKLGLQLFLIGSLYIVVVQMLIVSRHGVVGFGMLPPVTVALLALYGAELWRWFSLDAVLAALTLLAIAGWTRALCILTRRNGFRPVYLHTHTAHTLLSTSLQGSLRIGHIDLGHKASAPGSMLLGYPASLSVRLINIGNFVFLSPLLCLTIFAMTPHQGAVPRSLFLFNAYMLVTLFSGCLSAFFYGELGARARLLWLRIGGSRSFLWRLIEREIAINMGITTGVMLTVALAGVYVNDSMRPLHYGLISVAYAIFEIYRGLCARLYCWPSLLRALTLLLSLAAVTGGVIFTMNGAGAARSDVTVLLSIEVALVILALLFRRCAIAGFSEVDWLEVKHMLSKRAMAGR